MKVKNSMIILNAFGENESNFRHNSSLKKPKKAFYKKKYKSYQLLRESWKLQTKTFFAESTLHGVRYIAENDRPFFERFLWFICVVAGTISAMFIIVSLWEKFQTNPTITGLDTDFHNWDIPFPAITICPLNPTNDSILEDYIKEHEEFESVNNDTLSEFFEKLTRLSMAKAEDFEYLANVDFLNDKEDLKSLSFKLMSPCETILDECEWKTQSYNCCDGFLPVFTEKGFCYTFNSRHYERKTPWSDKDIPEFDKRFIKETDIKWSLKFNVLPTIPSTKNNLAVFIHSSDETPGIEAKPQLIWDYHIERLLFSMQQTYTTENAKELSIKQRHCIFDHEIHLKLDTVYTYALCTQQCRMDNSMRLCNCLPHFYPLSNGYKHCSIKELNCIARNLQQIRNIDKCNCQLGCSNTIYEVDKFNENDGSKPVTSLEAEFTSWPMIKYKREVLFGWVDLLVSFGGIAGLFLGFSLLSGVEFVYYFTIRAFCMVYKERDFLEQKYSQNYNKNLFKSKRQKSRQLLFANKKEREIYNNRIESIMNNKNLVKIRPVESFRTIPVAPFGLDYIN